MKNYILKFLTLLTFIFLILIVYLSTLGIETERFNNQIKNRIIKTNKNLDLDLDLKKIKLILDPFDLKIYAKTVGPTVLFLKNSLPLEYIKSEVSLNSLIKNKIVSSNIEIRTKSILLNDIIKFIKATNNSSELIILQKIIKKGHIILDLNFNIDDDGKIKNDYQIKGLIKDANINLLNKKKFEGINFNFNIKKDNYSFDKIKFDTEKINFISENINIKKIKNYFTVDGIIKNRKSKLNRNILKFINLDYENINFINTNFDSINQFSLEIDEKFNVNKITLNSDLSINQIEYKKLDIFDKHFLDINNLILFKNHKLKIQYKNNNLDLSGEGQIQIGKELDRIQYSINKKRDDLNLTAELYLKNIYLKTNDLLKNFFPKTNEKIKLINQKLKINYNKNNFSLSGSGKFKVDKDFEKIDYFFEKTENRINFKSKLNLEKTNFKIDNIKYKKKDTSNMLIEIIGDLDHSNKLNIKSFILNEDSNKIKIANLSLNNLSQIIKIDEAHFNYLDIEGKINIFSIKKINNDDYKIYGNSFNANSLITNLLKSDEGKENKLFEKNFSFDLNIKEVYLDKIHYVTDLKGNFIIDNNKVIDANILAFFNNKQKISFTINTNDQGEKITTLFSSQAKPLVNRYKFIKGFADGNKGFLDFYSSKKNGISKSKLIIDNFKVREIPALAKLLALASLQGIADLLTGEGIRFTDFEMNFTNENKHMKIQELYAIGPAISILLEGYLEEDNLISLRGTLVPATTVNRTIASLPLIGDLLIGKKVGEGVFGVSFKIKGPPTNLETTVNPIKTLTPRFITRTLEKIKKN